MASHALRNLAKFGLCGFLIARAASGGGDFWLGKPFQTWSPKEIEQLRTKSPWSHTVDVAVPAAEILVFGGEGRRRQDGGAPTLSRADHASTPDLDTQFPDLSTDGTRVVAIRIRWDSALPLRHARLREKYGDHVAPSAIDNSQREQSSYIITLSGFPALNEAHIAGGLDLAFAQNTTLAADSEKRLKPSDVDIAPRGRVLDVTFTFPKSFVFKADEEVQFSTAAGKVRIAHKFRLKEMMYLNNLAL